MIPMATKEATNNQKNNAATRRYDRNLHSGVSPGPSFGCRAAHLIIARTLEQQAKPKPAPTTKPVEMPGTPAVRPSLIAIAAGIVSDRNESKSVKVTFIRCADAAPHSRRASELQHETAASPRRRVK